MLAGAAGTAVSDAGRPHRESESAARGRKPPSAATARAAAN